MEGGFAGIVEAEEDDGVFWLNVSEGPGREARGEVV